MKNHFEIHIPPGQSKERLDSYLTSHIENATRTKVQEAIKNGEITVNGRSIKPSYFVQPNDVIAINLNRPDPPEVKAEKIPLDIVYEDDYLLVVNKPAGMVTHPAYKNYSGTLVNALMHHSEKLSQLHSDEDEEFDIVRPGIVHRLDKDTSGLLVVAKDETTHQKLAKQFAAKTSEREYNAIVWGRFKKTSGVIDAPLGRSKSDRKKVAVTADGKHAVTEYEVIEQFGYLALVKLHLRTGRTHQIRVHLAHINHPVFGDETYGGREIVIGGIEGKKRAEIKNLLEMMPRQALHAKKLGFVHPVSKEMMRFESEMPGDMTTLLKILNP
ncbi:MAG: RluA family pseudouridine synthase [Ignavibacteriales bacterium]|nr:RluA family pseudouridine synthase [Ignavibacteriales bacterium]